MNIKLIKKIAARYPFLARAFELGLISGFIYIIGVLVSGDLLDEQALTLAVMTPLLAALSKYKRDLEK